MDLAAEITRALGSSFTIERELLGGGMSRVFVAMDATLQRRVAIKVLAPELAATVSTERFRREILVAASLQHPNIVPVLSAAQTGELLYFIMPYVEGESLRARLIRGPLSLREAVSIMRDVARALMYAHDRGVVHRDIKPDNVILTTGAATVTDFGVSKAIAAARNPQARPRESTPRSAPGTQLTLAGSSVGTPAYMAPEQAAGDPAVDHRADIYALGILGFEALTGAPPFHGRSPQALMTAQLTETPPSLSTRRYDVSPALDALIARCLEKDPVRRPKSASEVMRALEAADIVSGSFGSSSEARKARRSRRSILIVAAAAALAAAIATPVIMPWMKGSTAVAPARVTTVAVDRIVAVPPTDADVAVASALTDAIIVELGRRQGVRVLTPAAAVTVRSRIGSGDPADRGTLVVEGTIQRDGERLRLTMRAVDGTGATRWSETMEPVAKRGFALQDELVRFAASGLLPLLDP